LAMQARCAMRAEQPLAPIGLGTPRLAFSARPNSAFPLLHGPFLVSIVMIVFRNSHTKRVEKATLFDEISASQPVTKTTVSFVDDIGQQNRANMMHNET